MAALRRRLLLLLRALLGNARVPLLAGVLLLLLPRACRCSTQSQRIRPGFQGSQMNWIDNNGLFLLSNSSAFAFGFTSLGPDPTLFLLAVLHRPSSRLVWAANPRSPVSNSDKFLFGLDGDARLDRGGVPLWSTNTSARGAAAMVLLDSGNLVVLAAGDDPSAAPLWQSFDHPTDTLLSQQSFSGGMKLTSQPNSRNLTYHLDIDGGDMVLLADFRPPQPYWTMKGEKRVVKNKFAGDITSALLVGGSWNLYGRDHSLLGQFIASESAADPNRTWAAVLGSDGFISFYNLDGTAGQPQQTKIPLDLCDTPEPCDPYYICSKNGGTCRCPAILTSDSNCNPDIVSSCGGAGDTFDLKKVDDGVGYFATGFVKPAATGSSLTGCRDACLGNCSCLALLFDNVSGNCFLFGQIGSLRQLGGNPTGVSVYIKISDDGGGGDGKEGGGGSKRVAVIVIIALVTLVVIVGLVYLAVRLIQRRKRRPAAAARSDDRQGSSGEEEEEDSFLENISGMPIRFSYAELREATDNFSVKLGQGGFGSVYMGRLRDGSRVAVKKLEGISQGKKEFRSEVSIIGSIHHIHLVRLRGFCAQGTHRLLAYEYMAKGSLDKWIFRRRRRRSSLGLDDDDEEEGSGGGARGGGVHHHHRRRHRHHRHQEEEEQQQQQQQGEGEEEEEELELDWEKRYNIALGTAKGLAYLHEDCESKIVHCDIKPENVLLDDNFQAKVSDFGLAKLMTREQSHVFTTLRGTRGYLAPEWITNYAISEKSDVYSYGMVLLEIIGGRKNFDPLETSEKAHFPSYAFKKMEEGRLQEVVDSRLLLLLRLHHHPAGVGGVDKEEKRSHSNHREEEEENGGECGGAEMMRRVERTIKVALWCIQEDMALRPSMTKVVQMLEGVCDVPPPPVSSQLGFRLYANVFKAITTSEEGATSSTSAPSDCNSDAFLSAVRLSGPR